MRTLLYLMRHGKTAWNQARRIQGHTDTVLSAQGKEQVLAAGRDFACRGLCFDYIISSDLMRAVQTAQLVASVQADSACLITEKRLREQHWGSWTGHSIQQLRMQQPQQLAEQEQAGWHFCPPQGESRLELVARARNALEELSRQYAGQTLLVVTHLGVIKAVLYYILQLSYLPHEQDPVKKHACHILEYRDKALHLVAINR